MIGANSVVTYDQVVAHGTPEQVAAKSDRSYTGRFLAKIVAPPKRRPRQRPKVAAAA